MSLADLMRVAFPSREELCRQGTRKEAVAELYDIWRVAHEKAMELASRLPEWAERPDGSKLISVRE
jgi:hypothetical protein